jgi:eukaryotic-like serine/threonine-protein kinase
MPLGPGSRLDAYELLQPLGAGGMGEVWLATEVRLGRKVALKLLPDELTRDPARVSRFQQEARAASGLSHPNVCTIHALGETAEGQHYIAMEYVEGETLRRRIAAGRLSIRESLDIAIQIASALAAAHAHGIVHRDIKPENVMLRPDGFVKVLDFGLAKLTAAAGSDAIDATHTAFRTDAGSVVGTVAYMSPEQARGQQVDARTDIWSFGCVLYEMVAGRSPFLASSSSDTLAAILDREPPPLARFVPEVPNELQRIVTKALRKDRAHRCQTVHDLLLDLQTLRDDLQARLRSDSSPFIPSQAAQGSVGAAPATNTRRGRTAAALMVVVIAAAVSAAVWRSSRGEPSATPAHAVERHLTRLTFGPGLQTDVTFSPDGRFIAYASDRSGNFDIWVQPVAERRRRCRSRVTRT